MTQYSLIIEPTIGSVCIEFKDNNSKVAIHEAHNKGPVKTWTEGGLFCVRAKDKTYKYPLINILRIEDIS